MNDASMKRIIVTNDDGSVSVIAPNPQCGLTVEEIAEKDVPPGLECRIIDVKDIPQDRTFRNAWKPDLSVDMDRARDIWRDKLRADREPELAKLDVAYQRADERGDQEKKAKIAKAKQALRDAPSDPRIDRAKTPGDLKKLKLVTE